MRAGRIVQVGDGETLYRTPAHPFVAAFLGKVNRLERDAAARDRQVLPLGGIDLPCPASCQGLDTLLARPEDLEVALDTTGNAFTMAWGRAEVVQRSFLGDRVQLSLRVADQSALLRADVARDHPARTGDTVGIRIHPERLMPLAEETTP